MFVLVNWFDYGIDRVVIEEVLITPQSDEEKQAILRDMHVAEISFAQAEHLIENGALDLRNRCVCGEPDRDPMGHSNEAGGYCCRHHPTCGFH